MIVMFRGHIWLPDLMLSLFFFFATLSRDRLYLVWALSVLLARARG